MKEVRHWKTGGTWNLFELGAVWVERYGAPDIFIHRGDLQRVLAEAVSAAAPSAIKLDARCVGIEQTADCARIHLERGGTAEGRLLIGADGVHSQVRAELFGAAKTAIHPLHRVARDHPGGAA